jgi:hypothetical protein
LHLTIDIRAERLAGITKDKLHMGMKAPNTTAGLAATELLIAYTAGSPFE